MSKDTRNKETTNSMVKNDYQEILNILKEIQNNQYKSNKDSTKSFWDGNMLGLLGLAIGFIGIGLALYPIKSIAASLFFILVGVFYVILALIAHRIQDKSNRKRAKNN
jgi:purine-cytosine permease-like protein